MTDVDESASTSPSAAGDGAELSGHAGELAVAVARAHGVETMFTLSGAHVFPMYDGAVKADPPMRLVDVRHEQTAAFAAEATGKLTRVPGLAVLTAGPGVTNGVSAIAQAQFAGSPMVVVGGRAPANRWGSGSLQELDQPPILAPVTKSARTIHTADAVARRASHDAFTAAGSPHRGPVFVDVPMDEFFNPPSGTVPTAGRVRGAEPDPDAVGEVAELLAARLAAGAGARHRRVGRRRRGGRAAASSRRPASRPSPTAWAAASSPAATRCWSPRRAARRSAAPTWSSWSARRWTSGSATASFGGKDGAHAGAGRARRRLPRPGVRPRRPRGLGRPATSPRVLDGLQQALEQVVRRPDWAGWVTDLQDTVAAAVARDAELLGAEADPIHPARIYGELVPRLADDAVVIGDGGDFVQLRRQVRRAEAARRLARPRPVRLPRRRARRGDRPPGSPGPSAQVVLLLGDGAAGFSLMDVDTLVRHDLPVVMVCGNNSALGAGEGPDADALRLRRGRRPRPSAPATTRSSRRSAAPARR